MKRIALTVGLLVTGVGRPAYAGIPSGYMGKPFDPAVAGGLTTPQSVKAGPYPVPGRLEFENHDMGGPNIGFFTTDHIQCGAQGYRTDDGAQEASLCLTSSMAYPTYTAPNGDVWYDTGNPALDGTTYPSATTTSVYIGAVRPGDWVNITVDVQTAGTYQVGSTWASGNGPLGLEGGNGDMELQVSVNDTLMLDWKDTFPNYLTTANFKHWKPYPDMGTVTLEAGLQVIKLDSGADPHLNLDYVLFSLVLPDGGLDDGDGGSGTGGPGTTSGDAGGAQDAGSVNDAASPADGPEPTGTGNDAAPVGAESETTGAMEAGTTGGGASEKSGCGCTVPGELGHQPLAAIGASLALLGVALRRRGAGQRRSPLSSRSPRSPTSDRRTRTTRVAPPESRPR
jgi:hypothetical protein